MGEIVPNCTRRSGGGTCSEISNSAGIFPARARPTARAAGYETKNRVQGIIIPRQINSRSVKDI
jgi:hypothetical protein